MQCKINLFSLIIPWYLWIGVKGREFNSAYSLSKWRRTPSPMLGKNKVLKKDIPCIKKCLIWAQCLCLPCVRVSPLAQRGMLPVSHLPSRKPLLFDFAPSLTGIQMNVFPPLTCIDIFEPVKFPFVFLRYRESKWFLFFSSKKIPSKHHFFLYI